MSASASIAITLSASRVHINSTESIGTRLPIDNLVQLINLGADGVFNPIDVGDASPSGLQRWVSGDDSVIDQAYKVPDPVDPTGNPPANGDFASTAAVDLTFGASTAGRIARTFIFELGQIPTNTKIGIRWFPGLLASDFYSGPGITLQAGQAYGQFTLQSPSLTVNGGDHWVMPGDGATVTFDGYNNTTNGAAGGFASFVVVPEPGSIVLSLLGAVGLAAMRRRRA